MTDRTGTCAGLILGMLLASCQAQASDSLTGVYLAASAASSSVDIDIRERGPFGSVRQDGAAASGAQAMAAIGTSLAKDGYYGSVEIYGGSGNADFTYRVGDDSLRLDVKNLVGLAFRAGREIHTGIAVYGMLGFQSTEVEETVTIAGSRSRGSDRFDGVRFGAGVEIAASNRLFGRLEYAMTRYNGETYGSGADAVSYEPSESQLVLAGGYRF